MSRILAHAGLVDPSWFTQAARDRGHTVHAIGEAYLRKHPIDVSPSFSGFALALRRGLDALNLQTICIEERLVLEDITGRPDVIGWLPKPVGKIMDGPVIVDIKSGARMPSHAIQLQLYERLAQHQVGLRDKLPLEFRELQWQRVGLYVRDNGRFTLHPYDDYDDRLIADAILDVTRWRIAHGLLKLSDVALQDDDPTFLEAYLNGE